mmetsp:Transcript_26083/g.54634  ORF Transcript_26083/g.54634 Transcript_26083/m.54634 type:complete len:334 (+) Transcript_26083:1519-2520(+)
MGSGNNQLFSVARLVAIAHHDARLATSFSSCKLSSRSCRHRSTDGTHNARTAFGIVGSKRAKGGGRSRGSSCILRVDRPPRSQSSQDGVFVVPGIVGGTGALILVILFLSVPTESVGENISYPPIALVVLFITSSISTIVAALHDIVVVVVSRSAITITGSTRCCIHHYLFEDVVHSFHQFRPGRRLRQGRVFCGRQRRTSSGTPVPRSQSLGIFFVVFAVSRRGIVCGGVRNFVVVVDERKVVLKGRRVDAHTSYRCHRSDHPVVIVAARGSGRRSLLGVLDCRLEGFHGGCGRARNIVHGFFQETLHAVAVVAVSLVFERSPSVISGRGCC